MPIREIRMAPPPDFAEHLNNAAEWALPPLLLWLRPETIIWALGMMMCEVKIIVVGEEPGIVSCAVIGLTALLRPLSWVAPIIPILPHKHIDFVESPVPIVVGVVQCKDSAANDDFSTSSLLTRCA